VKQWIAIAISLMFVGCKQGNGQRCQVNSDCISNLCSRADPKVCIGEEDADQIDIDATPMEDAAVDAGIDAPPDAPDA
jgi:hypothetical protein